VCCRVLQSSAVCSSVFMSESVRFMICILYVVLQCVAVCCSVLQCVAVRCSEWTCPIHYIRCSYRSLFISNTNVVQLFLRFMTQVMYVSLFYTHMSLLHVSSHVTESRNCIITHPLYGVNFLYRSLPILIHLFCTSLFISNVDIIQRILRFMIQFHYTSLFLYSYISFAHLFCTSLFISNLIIIRIYNYSCVL